MRAGSAGSNQTAKRVDSARPTRARAIVRSARSRDDRYGWIRISLVSLIDYMGPCSVQPAGKGRRRTEAPGDNAASGLAKARRVIIPDGLLDLGRSGHRLSDPPWRPLVTLSAAG